MEAIEFVDVSRPWRAASTSQLLASEEEEEEEEEERTFWNSR